MNCAICKTNKIDPKRAPYGGFLCGNGHMQCYVCNWKSSGRCDICEDGTKFVQMTLDPAAQVWIALLSNASKQSSCFRSNSLLDGIETQSDILQKHLSMNESKESGSVVAEEDHTAEKETKIQNKKSFANNDHSIYPELLQAKVQNEVPRTKEESSYMKCNQTPSGALHCGVAHPNDSGNVRRSVSILSPHRIHSNETAVDSVSNANVFIFQDDPDDHNVIHTSQLRFMDSAESLNNLLAGESPLQTDHKANLAQATAPPTHAYLATTERVVQLKPLSAKSLRDLDELNTAYCSSEVVESYLKLHGPAASYHFPNRNCPHQQCDFCWNLCQRQQKLSQMKRISVSTVSDPSLKSLQPKTTNAEVEYNLPTKFKTQDYVVMHTTGVGRLQADNVQCVDKSGRPSLDMQMQTILETFQEDPRVSNVYLAKGNVIKLAIPRMQPVEAMPQTRLQQQIPNMNHVMVTEENSDLTMLRLLNSHRALYQPTDHLERPICNMHTLPHPLPASQAPPPLQFAVIPCSPVSIQVVSVKAHSLNSRPLPASMLNIPRHPLHCPESTCRRLVFISDFNKHLVVDHTHLSIERITPFQCKNFFLDARLAHCGTSRCHKLYLLRDKLLDLGHSEYKDCLPVLVMTSRISLQRMCDVPFGMPSVEFLIIWLTGIVTEELPISVSLTVWRRSGKAPTCHLVYSGDMYSIRKSQQGLDVWKSGRMLMLSSPQVDRLTNGRKDMLNIQLVVH